MGRLDDDTGSRPFGASEPTFLNHQAWAIRWQDRRRSAAMADAVLEISRAAGKARAVGARRRNGLAMRTLAWQARWRGDFDGAETLAHRAIARLKGEGAEAAIADAMATLAIIHCVRGRRDLARDCVEEGFATLAHQPNGPTRIDLLSARAMIERVGRRMHAAQETMREAVAISSGAERARVEQSVARSLLHDDLPGEALEHATEAVALAREHRNRVVLPYALEVEAAALIELNLPDKAARALQEGDELAREDADLRAECHLLYQRVLLQQRRGDPAAALSIAEQGQAAAQAIGYPTWQSKFLDKTAQLQEGMGQTDAALRTLKRLIALREAERE